MQFSVFASANNTKSSAKNRWEKDGPFPYNPQLYFYYYTLYLFIYIFSQETHKREPNEMSIPLQVITITFLLAKLPNRIIDENILQR